MLVNIILLVLSSVFSNLPAARESGPAALTSIKPIEAMELYYRKESPVLLPKIGDNGSGPICLYQSEICFGQSIEWIENYACVYNNVGRPFPYKILGQFYLKIANEKSETLIDRFIGLEFDRRGKLIGYRIQFASFGGGDFERHNYFKLIFEQIGLPQLKHYTELQAEDYRDYIGTYEFDDCTVKFAIPGGDPILIVIEVNKK